MVFRTIIFLHQLSIYGVVSDLCKEYKASQVRTVRPVLAGQSDPLFEPASLLTKTLTHSTEVLAQEPVVRGQSSPSFVPSVMKTNIPLNDDPAQDEDLLHRYQEQESAWQWMRLDDVLSVEPPDECWFMKSQQNRQLHCSHYLTAKTRRISRNCPPSYQVRTFHSVEKKRRIFHQTLIQDNRAGLWENTPKVSHLCLSTKITSLCSRERAIHCLSSLQQLPTFSQLRRLPQVLHLITLTIGDATCWAVRGLAPLLEYCSTQGTDAVVHMGFRPAVLIGETPGSFTVCRQAFLYYRGLAFDIICSMQRLLCFGSDCFVSRTAVAQWNSHARTVLDIVEITTRNVSQTDPELDCLLVQKNSSASSDGAVLAPMHEGTPSETSPCDTDTTNKKEEAEIPDWTALLRESKRRSHKSIPIL